MPWNQTSPMDQRTQSVADFLRHSLSISELCELYCVSRKTGYKWIDRYLQQGPAGLQERSRRPHASPNATPAHVTAAFIELRTHHPSWGAKKLLSVLERRHPHWDLPGRSTVCDILSRNGLVPKQRRRRAIGHPGAPTTALLVPNVVWSADYKGQFKTGDGRYCYPLTVTDNCSRFLLGCQALTSTAVHEAKPVFTRLFKQYGLPLRIRTDNGVPFASNTLARLSQLSAWWVRLGILPEFIEPGKPQQNGRHERMHRTLKAETTRPPAAAARNSTSSIVSGWNSTTGDRTRRWTCKPRRPAMRRRRDRCPTSCRRCTIRIASRCATSAPTAASAGTSTGSTSRPRAWANTSAWRKSTTECGTCTSGRSNWDGCWSGTCASKTRSAD